MKEDIIGKMNSMNESNTESIVGRKARSKRLKAVFQCLPPGSRVSTRLGEDMASI